MDTKYSELKLKNKHFEKGNIFPPGVTLMPFQNLPYIGAVQVRCIMDRPAYQFVESTGSAGRLNYS